MRSARGSGASKAAVPALGGGQMPDTPNEVRACQLSSASEPLAQSMRMQEIKHTF